MHYGITDTAVRLMTCAARDVAARPPTAQARRCHKMGKMVRNRHGHHCHMMVILIRRPHDGDVGTPP